jgi:tripartite-type tricarboxylate transporter receptor subunit TctC
MLAAGPQTQFKTLDNVLTHARARPGVISYAHPGVASSPHLTGTEFFQRAKVSPLDVPFRGETAMVQPLREGSVDLAVVTVNFVDLQKLKPFVVFADKRYPSFPDVPTAKELGYPVTPSAYGGLFMRADTPAPIVKKVEAACRATMADAEFTSFANRNYQVTQFLDSPRFAARIKADSASKAELLKTVKLEK